MVQWVRIALLPRLAVPLRKGCVDFRAGLSCIRTIIKSMDSRNPKMKSMCRDWHVHSSRCSSWSWPAGKSVVVAANAKDTDFDSILTNLADRVRSTV